MPGKKGKELLARDRRGTEVLASPGSPPHSLSGLATACSPVAAPPKGPIRAYMQQLEARGLEQGFILNGKTKIIGGTSHSSNSLVYSAPLAKNEGLLFPAEDHCPGDGLAGKENVGGGSVLAVFCLRLTSGTQP